MATFRERLEVCEAALRAHLDPGERVQHHRWAIAPEHAPGGVALGVVERSRS